MIKQINETTFIETNENVTEETYDTVELQRKKAEIENQLNVLNCLIERLENLNGNI